MCYDHERFTLESSNKSVFLSAPRSTAVEETGGHYQFYHYTADSADGPDVAPVTPAYSPVTQKPISPDCPHLLPKRP